MIKRLIEEIKEKEEIDIGFCFNIVKAINNDLSTEDSRQILIYIMDYWEKMTESAKEILADLMEAHGFYPYLEKYKEDLPLKSTSALIRKNYHKAAHLKNFYFHEEQKILIDKIMDGQNIIVSAPTSFGKSLLIEEVVAGRKYENIVIIQPTLALLDETRKKMNKYKEDYKIIVKTTQESSDNKKNIFLLTAERVLEYQKLPKIDFLILDEFYKVSAQRDDERSDILNNALYKLLNMHKCQFLFLGPNIEKISKGFTDEYNASFFKTAYTLVANEEENTFAEIEKKCSTSREKDRYREELLFNLLYELKDEQTIIFCSSPSRVRKISKYFSKYLIEKNCSQNSNIPLVEWIGKNIHEEWCLVNCLKYGIGIHDGALPRHITSSIIDYFNSGRLKYLFCTTTIIEGVNTSAKNIVYFDKTKGNRIPIDYFDYSNIKGRAGRMMVHFVGKIYNFNRPPEKENIIIDIPFFEQNPISDEVLINLPLDKIKNPDSEQSIYLKTIPKEIKTIISKNGVSVKGQMEIIEKLNELKDFSIVNWTGIPTYEQLSYVLSLAWEHLIKEGESIRPMTKKQLVKLTYDYGRKASVQNLIVSNFKYYIKIRSERYKNYSNKDILDEAIKDAFGVVRHWFEYKIPKWLSVMHSLQEYVANKEGHQPGSYLYYSNMIENSQVPPHLSLLLEYNIPLSAIEKISSKIPKEISEDDVLKYIHTKKITENSNLIEYEKTFFNQNF